MDQETRSTESLHPLDVMRQTLTGMEIPFQEDDGRLFIRLGLENVEVQLVAWGYPDDLAKVIVRLPVRAAKKFRAAAGDFLHRLNCNARRKYWEMDCDNGEIRLSCFTDTMVGPLTEPHFRALLNSLVHAADAVFPHLAGVLNGRMPPDFAADQAEAAVRADWEGRVEK
jgi:hypothetical protein